MQLVNSRFMLKEGPGAFTIQRFEPLAAILL